MRGDGEIRNKEEKKKEYTLYIAGKFGSLAIHTMLLQLPNLIPANISCYMVP